MTSVPKLWPGSTIVCIGGGQSLVAEDVDVCRGQHVIAVNDAYRLAPWADVLYAADAKWWKWQYRDRPDEINAYTGLRYSLNPDATKYPNVQVLKRTGSAGLELRAWGLRTGENGGYQAINLAVHLGAVRVLLLGYDMQITGGQQHWFGKHDSSPSPSPYSMFRKKFDTLPEPLRVAGVTVINCSRETALTTFPRQSIREALGRQAVAA